MCFDTYECLMSSELFFKQKISLNEIYRVQHESWLIYDTMLFSNTYRNSAVSCHLVWEIIAECSSLFRQTCVFCAYCFFVLNILIQKNNLIFIPYCFTKFHTLNSVSYVKGSWYYQMSYQLCLTYMDLQMWQRRRRNKLRQWLTLSRGWCCIVPNIPFINCDNFFWKTRSPIQYHFPNI